MSTFPFAARTAFRADARIGIIGAGAAGLSVARALQQKGFCNVTVLEREGRVGGKCWTFLHEGRTYEMGAVALTTNSLNVRALIREFGIRESANEGFRLRGGGIIRSVLVPPLQLGIDPRGPTLLPSVLRDNPPWKVAASCLRFLRETHRYRALREPGMLGIPRELTIPFEQWAREQGITDAARLLIDIPFVAFGYGFLSETPAAYVLKYIQHVVPPLSELLDVGYQGLWEAVARGMDIRLGVNVRRVQRGHNVVVETDQERFTFDALVLAIPIDKALPFLDAAQEEIELASKIHANELRAVFVSAKGLPNHRYIVLPNHFDPATRGGVTIIHKRWKDTDVYGFYAHGREGISMDQTIGRVLETARALGGEITRVIRTHAWHYFPRVSCEDLAAGYFDRFEAMQGARRTYHAGELLTGGLVEAVVRQARDLVERHFPLAPVDEALP